MMLISYSQMHLDRGYDKILQQLVDLGQWRLPSKERTQVADLIV